MCRGLCDATDGGEEEEVVGGGRRGVEGGVAPCPFLLFVPIWRTVIFSSAFVPISGAAQPSSSKISNGTATCFVLPSLPLLLVSCRLTRGQLYAL